MVTGSKLPPIVATLIILASASAGVNAESIGTENGQWSHYGGDLASSRYSPLDQINRTNVSSLVEVWRWTSPDMSVQEANPRLRQGIFKPTPLMVDGLLYVPTSFSQVLALDPATGTVVWHYDPKSYEAGRPANAGFQHRGLEYWTDGRDQRLFIATGDRRLIAINAKTGELYPDFGVDGEGFTDTSKRLGRDINIRNYTHNSPVTVCGNTVVVGSIISDGPSSPSMPPGHVRGYDVRTGTMKWIFHTISQPGELGNETWENGSWEYTGNTNVWTTMACDPDLGMVYLPTSTPTNDWYGGHRHGDNLFAESIVALDAETGERMWHFQAVHHGLWDYDFPCAPNLVDIVVDGKPIKALAQVSKQGFTYVFNRETGEPVWPIEERPVPQTHVPGEKTSPTQPFPTKPPPFERQGVTVDDLIDFTPELRANALKILESYELGPIYTPPLFLTEGSKRGTAMLPSAAGGANWRGAAYDPETGLLYVPSMTLLMLNANIEADENRSQFTHVRGGEGLLFGNEGLPLIKPPYGRITAINLNRGDIEWMVPHGEGPRHHPKIAHLNLPRLGAAANFVLSNGGPMLTKELLFVIQAEEEPEDMMRMGKRGDLSAFDKSDGELVFKMPIEPTPHGNPMTYLHEDKQYIVLAAGGGGFTGAPQPSQLIAYALP